MTWPEPFCEMLGTTFEVEVASPITLPPIVPAFTSTGAIVLELLLVNGGVPSNAKTS